MVAGPRGSQDASRSLPLGKTVDERTVWASQRQYTGQVCIETQTRDGVGQYQWEDGFFRYEGQWVNGQKHGQGTLHFADGGSVTGRFERGEINGNGVRTWADGSRYEGQFVNGHRTGRGEYRGADGTKYVGQWRNNAYDGEGEVTREDPQLHYRGALRQHRFHGDGCLVTAEESYEGAFEHGEFHGFGKLEDTKGFVYEGYFAFGKRDGKGRGGDTASGLVYEGHWLHGEGKLASQLEVAVADEECLYVRDAAAGGKKDPKAKGAGPTVDVPEGVAIKAEPGQVLPASCVKVVDADGSELIEETGRLLRFVLLKRGALTEEGEDPPPAPVAMAGTPPQLECRAVTVDGRCSFGQDSDLPLGLPEKLPAGVYTLRVEDHTQVALGRRPPKRLVVRDAEEDAAEAEAPAEEEEEAEDTSGLLPLSARLAAAELHVVISE